MWLRRSAAKSSAPRNKTAKSKRLGRRRLGDWSYRPWLEELEERRLLAVITVNSTADDSIQADGRLTLREAIIAANTNAAVGDAPAGDVGLDTIAFNITGAGVHTIQPDVKLPDIIDPVLIDGYTQPGSSPNSLAVGNNAVLLIEINGALAGETNGLVINTSNSTIRGLVVNGFEAGSSTGRGIVVRGVANTDNVIVGNFLGVNAAGTAAVPNGRDGIFVIEADRTRIGGADPADRNVISGNTTEGIFVNAPNTTIQGNYVGTNAAGTAAIPNLFDGVFIAADTAYQIGGAAAGEGNLISGNRFGGLVLNFVDNSFVQGNKIGVAADGVTPLGNGTEGLLIIALAGPNTNNLVGGPAAGAANLIAFNGNNGILVQDNTAAGNRVQGNRIFANGLLGIDLGNNGVTANDAGDADTGANGLQNTPVLASAVTNAGATTIAGSFDGAASASIRIEFFTNSTADLSGFGEGETFLGFLDVTTDAAGHADFTVVVAAQAAGAGISATATNLGSQDTSEFAANVLVDALAVEGTAGADTLVVTATGPNSGAFSLNGGPLTPFADIGAFLFNGLGGDDVLRINNPAGGLFAPAGGILYHGGGQAGTPGDSLEILGGAHTSETHTFTPDGPDGHNGRLALVNGATTANYTYTGLEPILVNAGIPTHVVFNLPNGDGDNQAILEDDTAAVAGVSQIRSGNGTFETTTFVNPNLSLTVNYGNDGESVTVAQLDAGFTAPIELNGGAGGDRLLVDFASGNNVIPAETINFDGEGGADGITLLPGYNANTVRFDLLQNAQDGSVNVDGRLVTFTGQDSSVGISDQLNAVSRLFFFDSIDNIATLDTGVAASDGFSRISTNPNTSLRIDFRNSTASATVDVGNGNDSITVPGFDAVGATPTATFNGLGGDDTFNITASTTTAYTVIGQETNESATGDALNYNALGGTVTRTPSTGESGTLTNPGFQTLTFANLEDVESFSVPTISINDVAMAEGQAGTTVLVFTVTLSSASSQFVTVDFTTQDSSATVADGDYVANAGTLTFSPNTTTQTITVLGNGDRKLESTEQFLLLLSNATGGATFTDANAFGNITNDDPQPTISINDVALAEGQAGTTVFTFPVTLSNPSSQAVTVNYATNDGSATVADNDFVSESGVITFAPNTTTHTITIEVVGDANIELTEFFVVNLTAPTNATLNDAQGQASINNDDGPPPGTISINDVAIAEGHAGTTVLVFTVSLSSASANPVTVDFTTVDGTATTADNDYVANVGTLTFTPNVFTQTITVLVNGDLTIEPTQAFTVELSNPTGGAVLGDDTGAGTITNDDVQPTISINDVSLNEGNGPGTTAFTFTVTLSNPSLQTVTVDYATDNGSATVADNDFVAETGTVTFAANDTSETFTIEVGGDTNIEPNEFFVVNLTAPTNATINDAQGQGNLTNDDGTPPGTPTISLSINDVTLTEGNAGTTAFIFAVTLSSGSANPITVDFATQDNSATVADGDYVAIAGTLTFPPNATTQTITVLVNGDLKFEADERFLVLLSNATGGATFTDASAFGTILNDDSVPTISINDLTLAEGNGPGTTTFTFTVTLSNPSSQTVTVNYASDNGSATVADGDYVFETGTVTFAANDTSETITIEVGGDTNLEPNEFFVVNLTSPTNATILDGQGQGNILNDDPPTVAVDDVTVLEGDTGTTNAVFTVTLSTPSSQTVTVAFTTIDGTATVADDDYETTAGTLVFAPGQTTMTIGVPVNGDTKFEINFPDFFETFFVDLSNATDATLADAQGQGNITNDDPIPTVSIGDATLAEGNAGTTPFVFTVTLTNPSSQEIIIPYTTNDGTATVADGDYLDNDGSITFAPNTTAQTITVLVNGDTTSETDETFTVTLNPGAGVLPGDTTGQGLITNDEPEVSITANDGSAAEHASPAAANPGQFTVTRTGNTTLDLTVFYSVAGTATNGADYATLSGSVVIGAGQSSAVIDVNVINDSGTELPESVVLTLTADPSYALANPDSAFVVIGDNEPEVSITANDASASEHVAPASANPGQFTVTRTGDTTSDLTVSYTVSGTATDGTDYTTLSGSVVIGAGQSSATIDVSVINDAQREGDETVVLVLAAGAYTIADPTSATVTIADDEAAAIIAVGTDAGGPARVRVFEGDGTTEKFSFLAYGAPFTGGVRLALGDITGDGTDDIITAIASQGGPHVRVFDGTTGQPLPGFFNDFLAYNGAFNGGVFVSSGDVNGDGRDDIITAPGAGLNPTVNVFSGVDGSLIGSFFAFEQQWLNGLSIAVGDVNDDDNDDIIVGRGRGGQPEVRVFSGEDFSQLRSFNAYAAAFTAGVFVGAGDINGDGKEDVITGANRHGGPQVRVFSGEDNARLASFFAYDKQFTGGVRVAASDVNGDGLADIVTGAGTGGGPQVRIFSGADLTRLENFLAFENTFRGGIFVAGAPRAADALHLASDTPAAASRAEPLSEQQLHLIRSAALEHLAATGVSEEDLDRLVEVNVGVSDLAGDLLGLARGSSIRIDSNAAGRGWFIDPTPETDDDLASDRVDLLTALLHEFGHVLGLEHDDAEGLMHDELDVCVRLLPTAAVVDAVFVQDGNLPAQG